MLIFFYLPTIPFIPKPANKFLPLRIIPIFVAPHPSTAPRSLPTRLENRYNASGQVPKGIFHIRLSDFHHQHVNKSPTEQSTQTDRQTGGQADAALVVRLQGGGGGPSTACRQQQQHQFHLSGSVSLKHTHHDRPGFMPPPSGRLGRSRVSFRLHINYLVVLVINTTDATDRRTTGDENLLEYCEECIVR